MDIRYMELRPANKDCKESFAEIAKKQYKNIPVFQSACDYVNSSASYKRTGRHLEIIEITDEYIRVKLTSESKLEMASKSIAGFTRELLRIDQELHPDETERMFRLFLYNNTLFRNTQISNQEELVLSNDEMSDVDALKMCVDLFCKGMTLSKEEAAIQAKYKKEIKAILKKYGDTNRMFSYMKEMR